MCSTEAVMLGGKIVTDIQKERQGVAASTLRANQQHSANRIQSAHIRESLKQKLVSSLKQEAQEAVKTAKKVEKASRQGRAEYASIIAQNPLQFDSNNLEYLLRDSQRREAETKFSMNRNLATLKSQLATGRQVNIYNTRAQLASLPIPDAFGGNVNLAILGAIGKHGDAIKDEYDKMSSGKEA